MKVRPYLSFSSYTHTPDPNDTPEEEAASKAVSHIIRLDMWSDTAAPYALALAHQGEKGDYLDLAKFGEVLVAMGQAAKNLAKNLDAREIERKFPALTAAPPPPGKKYDA